MSGQPSTDPKGATTIGRSTEAKERSIMSVYRVIDVVGTSPSSWEEAAAEAITTAGGSVRDIRVAEVTKQDILVGDAGELLFRTKIQLSFKYESE
jgi:dodecin